MRRLPDGKVVYDEDTPAEKAMMSWFERIVGTVAIVALGLLFLWAVYNLGIKGGWRDMVQHFRDDPPDLFFFVFLMVGVIANILYSRWKARD